MKTKNKTIKTDRARETIEYPDGMIFYSYKRAKEVLDKIQRKRFTITDSILLLLYSHAERPIFGRVQMIKQLFLLTREVLNEDEVQDANFVPYRYGMYSFTAGNTLTNLEFSGYIERRGRRNSKLEQFRITEKGKQYIARIFDSLPQAIQEKIREKRKGWDQLGYDGILRLVYQKYPEYKEESRLKERYKPIKWGRGIG